MRCEMPDATPRPPVLPTPVAGGVPLPTDGPRAAVGPEMQGIMINWYAKKIPMNKDMPPRTLVALAVVDPLPRAAPRLAAAATTFLCSSSS